jgi:hypothetical protein
MKLLRIISVDSDVTDKLLSRFSQGKIWEYNETVHQLFMDFMKAYDTVRRGVLYNILIEFGVPMKSFRRIQMCVNETYCKIRIGKYLSDIFPIRNGRI